MVAQGAAQGGGWTSSDDEPRRRPKYYEARPRAHPKEKGRTSNHKKHYSSDSEEQEDHHHDHDHSNADDANKGSETFSSVDPVPFDDYVTESTMSVVACHAEGESCDVVIGGIPDIPGESMYYKQLEFMSQHEWRRELLLNEPRGHCGQNAVFILPPCNPRAVRGLIFAKNDDYVPISISSLMAAAQVTVNGPGAESQKLPASPMKLSFDTPAGLINVDVRLKAQKRSGVSMCESVTVHGLSSFVMALDFELDLYGLGILSVDIAYGGTICAFVDAASVGVSVQDGNGQNMIEIGERIKNALHELYEGAHPFEPTMDRVNTVVFTDPIGCEDGDARKKTHMAAVVSPGRLDRSPSGTAVCARLAILHARGEISRDTLTCQSIIGTKFYGRVRGTTTVDKYPAILPSVMGRAWIHSLKQVGMSPADPFPDGFRNADQWGPDDDKKKNMKIYKPRDLDLPEGW
ncbi:proline racemase family [Penicillium cosmopolitanum]|uniref:Proline racemase family n=1 Tax=Penicillium cosmopolitanum TaxID=1131564 RepID=A0A9W9W722_9EURO|nr:proline racemase family [Penicillium cosmopolitanum]KAJ5407585.1 proline racemase family [Penicillium cosmopolitanum]